MPHSEESSRVQFVTEDEIRKAFNEGRYVELAEKDELIAVEGEGHVPKRLPPTEPPGTKSMMVYYYKRDRELVAMAHQYLRPDGTIGGKGRPDPKWLNLGDHVLKVRPRRKLAPRDKASDN